MPPSSDWGRSTSSTRKTPEYPALAKGLLKAVDAAEAAEAAAEVAAAAARPEDGRFWFSALVTDRAMEAWYNFSNA
jgi:hypothetical protein